MIVRSRWLPWLVAAVLAALVLGQWGREARRTARIAALTAEARHLQVTADSLRLVVAGGTARVDTLIRDRWQPARLRVDTLSDTVPVPIEVVREVVAVADTTIRACRVTLAACALLAATERARADTLGQLAAQWRRAAAGPPLTLLGYGVSDLRGHWYAGAEVRLRLPLGLRGYGRAEVRVDSLSPAVRVGLARAF